MTRGTKTLFISGGLLAATASIIAFIMLTEPPPLEFDSRQGIVIFSPPIALPDVRLTDHNHKPYSMNQLKGRWNMVFFGYTHCPDVCPTTMAALQMTAKQLSPEQFGYYFITLDPRRDTPEKLQEFVTYFNPAFTGLGGEQSEINRLSEELGIVYDYEGDQASSEYIVNHYTAILVIDPDARMRAHILPPHPVSKVINAMTRINEYYGD